MLEGFFHKLQNAFQVPFNNLTNGFTATEVQSAIEEVGGSLVLTNIPCLSDVFVGAAVRMNGGTAENALADTLANSNVIGVVEFKPTTTTCHIRVLGLTPPIFSGLDETKEFFLSAGTDGLITPSPPTGSGEIVVRLGQPFDDEIFLMNKGIRMERV